MVYTFPTARKGPIHRSDFFGIPAKPDGETQKKRKAD